jgi:hypothetical protein
MDIMFSKVGLHVDTTASDGTVRTCEVLAHVAWHTDLAIVRRDAGRGRDLERPLVVVEHHARAARLAAARGSTTGRSLRGQRRGGAWLTRW